MPPLRQQPVHAQLLHSLDCKFYLDNSAVLKKNKIKSYEIPRGKQRIYNTQTGGRKGRKSPAVFPFT